MRGPLPSNAHADTPVRVGVSAAVCGRRPMRAPEADEPVSVSSAAGLNDGHWGRTWDVEPARR